MIKVKIENCIEEMLSYIESTDYAGYDPYDALNSPLIKLVSSKSKYLRIAFTQFFRRCPVNLRPILGIKKGGVAKWLQKQNLSRYLAQAISQPG